MLIYIYVSPGLPTIKYPHITFPLSCVIGVVEGIGRRFKVVYPVENLVLMGVATISYIDSGSTQRA